MDMMNLGDLDSLNTFDGENISQIQLSEIQVRPQHRKEFDSVEDSLQDLADNIKKHGVFQPILLRQIDDPKQPFLLVAGERRYRAAMMAGLVTIPAIVKELTDDEAAEIQFAENVHRKNLTQLEVAQQLQRDLDTLGSVEAVCKKHNKSNAWVSKWLQLMNLPEQTERLMTENISADVEVINMVKLVEKADPEKAKELVDDLKKTRGESNTRKKVKQIKEQVKPPKAPKATNLANVAKPIDESHKAHGPVTTVQTAGSVSEGLDELAEFFADAKNDEPTVDEAAELETTVQASKGFDASAAPALPPAAALDAAFIAIAEQGKSAKEVIEQWAAEERDACYEWLTTFYEVGTTTEHMSRAVLLGLRQGSFANEGHGAFALSAFLHGADSEGKVFNLLDILSSVKP